MILTNQILICICLLIVQYLTFSESQVSELKNNWSDIVGLSLAREKRQSYYGPVDRDNDEFDSRRCILKLESTFQQCCIIGPRKSFQVQKMWDLKLQCISEVFGNVIRSGGRAPPCDRITLRIEQLWCLMQCISKKLNLLDEYGNFIEQPLKSHVKNDLIQETWQRDVTDNIVELCSIEVRTIDPLEHRDPSSKCRSTSLRLFNCVWREMIKACPRHLQSNSLGCLRMRQNLYNYENINDDGFIPSSTMSLNRNRAFISK